MKSRNALATLAACWALARRPVVHDAVRPLVSAELILRVVKETREKGATIPVVSLSDTIKEIKEGIVSKTIDRSSLFAVQTPQGFPAGVLKNVYQRLDVTDPEAKAKVKSL